MGIVIKSVRWLFEKTDNFSTNIDLCYKVQSLEIIKDDFHALKFIFDINKTIFQLKQFVSYNKVLKLTVIFINSLYLLNSTEFWMF